MELTEKKSSLLKGLLEPEYNDYKHTARIIVAIFLILSVILWTLSYFFYWPVVCWLLHFLSGFTLITLVVMGAFVLLTDIQVNVPVPQFRGEQIKKTLKYKLVIAWNILVLITCIVGFYQLGYLRTMYNVKCSKVYVADDEHFHIFDDCEDISGDGEWVYGHEALDNGKIPCQACEEYVEEMESETIDARYDE